MESFVHTAGHEHIVYGQVRKNGLEQLWYVEDGGCGCTNAAVTEAHDGLRCRLLFQALDDEQLDRVTFGRKVSVEPVLELL